MSKNSTSSRAAQFEFERILRERILGSLKEDREAIVEQAYSELFERFPDHSVFLATQEEAKHKGKLGSGLIIPLSKRGSNVLEVGCGRGNVLMALAEQGRICTGTEISQHMLQLCNQPDVKIVRGSADSLYFPTGSFDVVFSQEVLEHLHPEDVPRYFAEAFRVLRPNGILAVETPNRRTGPQDISRGFTSVAEGLHLKEWAVRELIRLFKKAGFIKIRGLLVPQVYCQAVGSDSPLCSGAGNCQIFSRLGFSVCPDTTYEDDCGKISGIG